MKEELELELVSLTLEEREKIFEGYKLSGLNQKDYCNLKNLSPSKFSYWYKKYLLKDKKVNFTEIQITKQSNSLLELSLPRGIKLSFTSNTDLNLLNKILDLSNVKSI